MHKDIIFYSTLLLQETPCKSTVFLFVQGYIVYVVIYGKSIIWVINVTWPFMMPLPDVTQILQYLHVSEIIDYFVVFTFQLKV